MSFGSSGGIHYVSRTGRIGLLWSSIGLAVLTSLLQGFITTVIDIAEEQDMWTFRFRIARLQHHWWTAISILLSTSFILIVLSFLAGNHNDSLGVLALSTATTITIVRYAIPSWRNRRYVENRWLAWTGPSRTGVQSQYASVCGDANTWERLSRRPGLASRPGPPSDEWGFALKPTPGIPLDPTAVLRDLGPPTPDDVYNKNWEIGISAYDDGIHSQPAQSTISLLWGESVGFRRRVSRAVNSVPKGLLQSKPRTTEEYNGEGLCLALGIFGRNKGLRPWELAFDSDDSLKKARGLRKRGEGTPKTTAALEDSSSWEPRPNKVMRSHYQQVMAAQYGGLGAAFVAAATELALILLDCPPAAAEAWLRLGLEHQSLPLNWDLSRPALVGKPDSPAATPAELRTLYRAQYASLILSLNFFAPAHSVVRPDLTCFALLHLADGAVTQSPGGERYVRGAGAPEPRWWSQKWVGERLRAESESLGGGGGGGGWKRCAAWLLALAEWPTMLEDWPHWQPVVETPVY